MTNSQFIGDQVQSGLLVDLTSAVENGQNYEKDANWGETINPTLLSNCKATLKAIGSDYADKLYGVPFTMTTVAVIYDKNVYKELGLSVPATWEEFEKNCEAIKAAAEILAVCRGECSRDVFPHHVSRSNKVSWYISPLIRIPHFFYDSYLFHEQAGAFSRKPLTFPAV